MLQDGHMAVLNPLTNIWLPDTGPLFIKRTDVLPQDVVRSRSHDISFNDHIAL